MSTYWEGNYLKAGKIEDKFKSKIWKSSNCWRYKTHLWVKQWEIKQSTYFPSSRPSFNKVSIYYYFIYDSLSETGFSPLLFFSFSLQMGSDEEYNDD